MGNGKLTSMYLRFIKIQDWVVKSNTNVTYHAKRDLSEM